MSRRFPISVTICLAFAIVSAGCYRKSPDAPNGSANEVVDKPQNPASQASHVAASEIPLESLLSSDAVDIPDNLNDWSVEAFQESVGGQLRRLKKFILESKPGTPLPATIAAVRAWSGNLATTDESVVVYEDESLSVQRWESTSPDQQQPRRALFDQLRSLATHFEDYSDKYGQLKISGVEELNDHVQTTIEVQFVGKSDSRVIQYDARWNCGWSKSSTEQPRLQFIQPVDTQTLTTSTSGPMFRDHTNGVIGATESFRQQLALGVDHWMERIEQRHGINSSGWQGLAIGDVNGDALDDVYVMQPGGLPNRLYVQQQDGTVKDTSVEAGVDWWDHSHGALFLDLDNDADQDLVLATALGLIFMSNDGSGRFQVMTTKLCPQAMPFTLATADFDSDGDLDVYACCYSPRGNAIGTQFLARPVPYHDANNGGRNCLFRNEGSWNFTNATVELGLDVNNRRFSLAASWEDYDNDGDQDLYVANDYGRNNLYRNDRGRFTDVAEAAGVEDMSAGMSVSWSDYNRDGNLDLYVSNMWSSAGNRITYQRQFREQSSSESKSQFQRHARGNSLFASRGDGTFADETPTSGVSLGRWAWGSRFVDLNNDSWDDLVVANGFITQPDTTDL